MVQAGKSTNSDGENEKKGDSLNGELENSESKPSSRDRCHSLSRLIDDSSVLLSCFSLSCETFFLTEVSPIQPEDSSTTFFMAIVCSRPWVRKLLNREATR